MCHPHAMTARSATEYTPAQVVEETGLSIDTLRYYEKIGLLDPVDRDAAGRRRFSDHHLEQLSVARCLRESGMPVADVARYAEMARAGDHTIEERIELLEAHGRRVRAQIDSLQDQQRYIERKIAYYRTVRPR
jgi:DNA-binding transcriptional MerR regulator